jgi:mono/diheme cytochrome c family protein
MKRKWTLLPALLLIACSQPVLGQDWLVPDADAAIANPSPYTLENVKAGKDLYMLNCKSCHGDPGKNNPLALVPLPVDIASERMHLNSEGAMFYKISNGRGVMSAFKSVLSEDERWNVINFIMNYKPGGEVLLVEAPPIKAKLLASVNEDQALVEILAEHADEDSEIKSLVNAPVLVSSKKAFGNIEIGRVTTNENGRAEFNIPESLIGDEEGYVSIVVSLSADYEAQEVALERARVGRPKEVPKLIRKEVLWSTNDNVSLWLLFSYLLAAGGAWAIIGYVIYQIVKIKKYSKLS